MRILVSISFFSPYISGLTISARNYAEGLASKGHEVSILTTQHDKSLSTHEILTNLKIIRVPYLFSFHKGFFMPSFFYIAWENILKNDVVIINLPQAEGFLVALIARIFKKKVISIYHCEILLPKGLLNKIIEYCILGLNFLALFFSHEIIAYTEDYAKSTKLLPLFYKKCSYILPPVSKPAVNNSLLKQIKNKINKNSIVIGVAARIAAEKGIEYLIDAIPILESSLNKNITILIAGPKRPVGENKYWEMLQSRLNMYENKIIFLGGVSQKDLGAFYSSLDILVLPSVNKTEAFGLVQVEAMMLGVPVVASNLPGVRVPVELTVMGETSKPKDTNDLAQKIIKILKNKDDYKSKKDISIIFSYNKAIDSLENLIKS